MDNKRDADPTLTTGQEFRRCFVPNFKSLFDIRRQGYLLLFLVVLFITPLSAEARDRQSKTLVLKNGLAVLLVHDPEAHRSAAALSVGVGSLYDPDEKHMLFLVPRKSMCSRN